jgi:predicted dehydrogenase
VRCADVDGARAELAARRAGVERWGSVADLFADPDVDIVVNLTPPLQHAEVTAAAFSAGKHVYTEKPVAAEFADAAGLLAAAERAGRVLGSAPDTFLGSAGQTARAALDSGEIGEPIGATAFVTHSKAEHWHPDPSFLFRRGGGPSLDMGPYYLSALVNLLGPVARVYSVSRIGAAERTVSAPARLVDTIAVEIPTHCAATLTFRSGVLATVMMSFDVWHRELPYLEIYGSHGTLSLPDPNRYDGDVRVRLHADTDWRVLDPLITPLTAGVPDDQLPLRGPGVADLVAHLAGAPHRTGVELAVHVLEVLSAIAEGDGRPRDMTTTCARPTPADVPPAAHEGIRS